MQDISVTFLERDDEGGVRVPNVTRNIIHGLFLTVDGFDIVSFQLVIFPVIVTSRRSSSLTHSSTAHIADYARSNVNRTHARNCVEDG